MKLIKSFVVFITYTTVVLNAAGQADPYINVLTQNGGIVNQGGNVFIEVTVGNAGPVDDVPAGKVIAQISVPGGIVTIAGTGHVLPAGWTIVSNSGSSILICNSGSLIALFDEQTILISVHGNNIGGPSTILGQLSTANSCVTGGSISGDDNSNNSSSSTIQVLGTTPVTLTDFNSTLVNCQPVLHWVTETEINSDRFEIERGNLSNSDWTTIGAVASHGNTTIRSEYNFQDRNLNGSSEKIFYRLKMIDKDGSFKYSKVLRVSVNCTTKEVTVYPNPVQDGWLYVSVSGTTGYTEATLLSQSGQVILKNKMNNGTNHLNVSAIADGVYILNIKDANGIDKNVKVFIQH